jgi:choline dehydrogenase-like flavoprotein
VFADLRTDVVDGQTLEFDVAIAGAGPAGITVALELMRSGLTVGLFEGGGMDDPGDGQDLYQGTVGQRPYPLEASRQRFFGGSSNHWGGWCRPLDAIDLESRDWMPHSGWPVAYGELERWYPRAHDICQIGASQYVAERVVPEHRTALVGFSAGADFVTKLFRSGTAPCRGQHPCLPQRQYHADRVERGSGLRPAGAWAGGPCRACPRRCIRPRDGRR